MDISAKVVLITGASRGLGAACAAAFRERGAKLSLTARSEDLLRQVARGDEPVTAGDITVPAVRRAAVDRTVERYGAIDILVNNAGVGLYAPSWSADLDLARAMFELNVFAPIALTQLAVPYLRQRRGLVVNISSIAGQIVLPWFTLYSATKHALGALTGGLRMELRRDGVRAMAVCPGYIRTEFQDRVLGGQPPEGLRRSKKFAITPEACAGAIVRGVERDARTVVTPRVGWLIVGLQRVFPSLVEAQMCKMYESRTR